MDKLKEFTIRKNLTFHALFFQGDIKKLYEELSDFLLQKVQEQSMNLTNKSYKLPQDEQVITVSLKYRLPKNTL